MKKQLQLMVNELAEKAIKGEDDINSVEEYFDCDDFKYNLAAVLCPMCSGLQQARSDGLTKEFVDLMAINLMAVLLYGAIKLLDRVNENCPSCSIH